MIDRRKFIHRIRDGLLVVGVALAGCGRVLKGPAANEQERLFRDIEALRARDYSEVGVSMILACENLAGDQPPAAHPENTQMYEAFSRYAEMFVEQKPDASEDDVAALVELVADRDFTAGGREFPL